MDSKKIFVVGYAGSYPNWIEAMGFKQTKVKEEADLVMFTGGEDVDPELYGQPKGHYTSFNKKRDSEEIPYFKWAFTKGIPMVGICRGSQLTCVLSGGKLVQDMNHPSNHMIETIDGEELEVSSSHHQQMIVDEGVTGLKEGVDYELIGWAKNLSYYHTNGNNLDYNFTKDYKEPEIVFFKETKVLAIQSHPEWQSMQSETVKYLQNLVTELINETICQKENELV